MAFDPLQYLAANPQLKAAFDSGSPLYVPPNLKNDPAGWATWHYTNYGQAEGRPLAPDRSDAGAALLGDKDALARIQAKQAEDQRIYNETLAAASQGTPAPATQPSSQPAQQSVNAQMYFAANPELKAAFDSKNPAYIPAQYANDPQGFATWHYNTYGKAEGRPLSIDAPTAGALAPDAFATTNPADSAVNPTNPIGKLLGVIDSATYKAAEKYLNNHNGASASEALKAAGLTDQQIGALGASFTVQKVGDPKTPEARAAVEAAQAKLIPQLDPAAYANAAKQSGMSPDQLIKNMTFDLARYGIDDMSQVGVSNVAGKTVYFNKVTGDVLPERFGSDMSGKGGNYFEFQPGPNGQAVPVPSWTDTSDKQDIAMVVGAALAVAAPVLAPQLAAAAGVNGAIGTGALYGGAAGATVGGISGGAKGALTGGLTGAALGAAGGAISDYANGTGMFSSGAPVTDATINYTPGNGTFNALGDAAGYTAPNYSLGSGSGGTGLQGGLSNTDYGFTGSGGAGLQAPTAPNLGSMGGAQGLLGTNPQGQTVGAGGVVTPNPGITTSLANDPYNTSQQTNATAANQPQGPAQTDGTPGPSTPPQTGGGAGGALGTGLTAKELVGLGLTGAGAVGKLTQDEPDMPDLPGSGSLGGSVGGADFGAGGAIGAMQGAVDRDQQIRSDYADKLDPYLADWLKAGSDASKGQAELAGVQRGLAEDQAKDYRENFAPVNKALADEALRYGKADDQERQARKASQSANEQTNAAVDAANQQLADMGVDASSGRFFGANLGARIKGAASAAGAGNAARESTRDKGIAARTSAAGVGLNLNQQAQSGLSASGDTLTKSATSQAGSVAGGISTGEFKAGNAGTYMEPAKTAIQADLGLQGIKAGLYKTDAERAAADSAGWGNLVGVGLGLLTGKG